MDEKYLLLIGVLVLSTGTVFAQESYLTIQTDDFKYGEGDIIVISGQVSKDLGYAIGLQILFEDDLIELAQISVAKDGSFSHVSYTGGVIWEKSGEYVITATYGPENIAETTINFSKERISEVGSFCGPGTIYDSEKNTCILESEDDGWIPINEVPTIDDYDPDVEIQRLQEENQMLREEIKELIEIIMEQINVMMQWIDTR